MEVEQDSRRSFLKQFSAIGVLGAVVAAGVGSATYLQSGNDLLLRPPSAVDEDDFLALCVKCGQCLQVCPYDSIRLADANEGNGVGTPYIEPLRRGCYLCPLLPCVLACPSGALDHDIEDVRDSNMGIAIILKSSVCLATKNIKVPRSAIDRIYEHTHTLTKEEKKNKKIEALADKPENRELEENVLKKLQTFEGKECTLCADMCPLPNAIEAIEMVDNSKGGKIPIIKEACVGCGVCVEICPEQVLAIKPRLNYEEYYIKGKRDA